MQRLLGERNRRGVVDIMFGLGDYFNTETEVKLTRLAESLIRILLAKR